jgi:hypothetical protein
LIVKDGLEHIKTAIENIRGLLDRNTKKDREI